MGITESVLKALNLSTCYPDREFEDRILQPENALLLAILEDGLFILREYNNATDVKAQVLFNETLTWLMQHEANYIFSFRSICELLDIDPSYLRNGVLEVLNKCHDQPKRSNRKILFTARKGRPVRSAAMATSTKNSESKRSSSFQSVSGATALHRPKEIISLP